MNRPPRHEPTPSERMNELELSAQQVRARLTRAVDALDSRRRQIVHLGSQAKYVAKPIALSTLGVVALCGGVALGFGLSMRARRRNKLSVRFAHAVRELDLVRPPSLGSRILERVAVAALTFALGELVKRSAKNWGARLPERRHHSLAGGSAR